MYKDLRTTWSMRGSVRSLACTQDEWCNDHVVANGSITEAGMKLDKVNTKTGLANGSDLSRKQGVEAKEQSLIVPSNTLALPGSRRGCATEPINKTRP